MEPIIIEQASYCIQFEIGTETVKSLKFIKISQASQHIIIDLSEWRELESRRVREYRKELAMSKSLSRRKYRFSYDSNEKYFVKFVDLGYGNSFRLLTSEHLLQMIFENWLNLTSLQRSEEVFQSLKIFPT